MDGGGHSALRPDDKKGIMTVWKGGDSIPKLLLPLLFAAMCLSPFASASERQTPADLGGKKLAVFAMPVDITPAMVKAATGVLPGEILSFDTLEEAISAVQESRADMLLCSDVTAKYIENSTLDEWTRVPYADEIPLVMVVSDQALLAALNDGIAALWENGTAEKLHDEWCVRPMEDGMLLPKSAPSLGGELLRVGYSGACPPFESVRSDGALSGLNAAVIRTIADQLDFRVSLIQLNADECLTALKKNELDIFFHAELALSLDTAYATDPYDRCGGLFLVKSGR